MFTHTDMAICNVQYVRACLLAFVSQLRIDDMLIEISGGAVYSLSAVT